MSRLIDPIALKQSLAVSAILEDGQHIFDIIDAQPTIEPTPQWIPCTEERMPKDCVPVNITWVNRKPTLYYSYLKDVPFTATGVRFRGKWYWWTSDVIDYLSEYGRAEWEKVDDNIEITAWMPLPEPYKEVDNETN